MKLGELSFEDFKKLSNYICSLCGFPIQNDEKNAIIHTFLRNVHGYNTIEDLNAAFTAFAAGRLDEKTESVKSFTGLSASRILQSYLRTQRKEDKPDENPDRSLVNDENKQLILSKFGRYVKYRDEVTNEESDYLMEYWIDKSAKAYLEKKSPLLCTVSAFDHLERKGQIRNQDGQLQAWNGHSYMALCGWDYCERGGQALKYNEEMALSRARQGDFRSLIKHNMGISIEDAIKRFALGVYYESLS